jgi:aminopeptidase N
MTLKSGIKFFILLAAFQLGLAQIAFSYGQLPKTVKPIHYFIFIHPNFKKHGFGGREYIDIKILKPTQKIVMNSLNLKIISAEILKPALKAKTEANSKTELLTLTFPKLLEKGYYQLELTWIGKMSLKPRGLFYIPGSSWKKTIISTQFESVDARRMFPGWDEPAFKATFQLSVKVPKIFMAVSNMPIKRIKNYKKGEKLVIFYPSPIMSSYLVELTAGKLGYISGESDRIKIRVIAPLGQQKKGEYALGIAEKDLHYYDKYYGIKYPLPKLDLIAVPGGFGGAMENWGAITFSESLLLFNPKTSSLHHKITIYEVVSHEMAHQWTGDLVTMNWWNNIWLNEGFADWMMDKVTAHFNPEWHINLLTNNEKNNAMVADAFKTIRPIERKIPVGRMADIAFSSIVYRKAATLVKMLQEYLGPEVFQKGIQHYLRVYKYSNATSSDLWNSLELESGKPVAKIAERWITQPGFPQIYVHRSCSGKNEIITLTQSRYSIFPGVKNYLWRIPVYLTLDSSPQINARFILWKKKKIAFGPDTCGIPVVFHQQGYYRIHYSQNLFKKMIKNLPKLSMVQRINFLNDTWAFVENGEYPANNYFALIKKFQFSTNLAVWGQILGGERSMGAIPLIYKLENKTQKAKFRKFAIQFLVPVYKKTGWNVKPHEKSNLSILRKKVLQTLAMLGDKPVISRGLHLFKTFLSNPNSVSGNLRSVVLYIGGRYGGKQDYNELYRLVLKAKTVHEKRQYLFAMASTRNPILAKKFIHDVVHLSLSHRLDPVSSGFSILGLAFSGHPKMVWHFTKNHLHFLQQRIPAFMMSFYLQGLMRSFNGSKTVNNIALYARTRLSPIYQPVISKGLEYNQLYENLRSKLIPQISKIPMISKSGSSLSGLESSMPLK